MFVKIPARFGHFCQATSIAELSLSYEAFIESYILSERKKEEETARAAIIAFYRHLGFVLSILESRAPFFLSSSVLIIDLHNYWLSVKFYVI